MHALFTNSYNTYQVITVNTKALINSTINTLNMTFLSIKLKYAKTHNLFAALLYNFINLSLRGSKIKDILKTQSQINNFKIR